MKSMAESVQKMSERNAKLVKQVEARAQKKESQEFSQYMEAALMGWAGVRNNKDIPKLWIKFLPSKKMEDHRLNLHQEMKRLAKKMEMEFEQNC